VNKKTEPSQSNLIPGGPLDKAFVVFHRMIMTMDEAEPTVKTVLLAYDEADEDSATAIMVSNLKNPASVEELLKEGLNSATVKRVLGNTVRN
jgi:hypothetical protein